MELIKSLLQKTSIKINEDTSGDSKIQEYSKEIADCFSETFEINSNTPLSNEQKDKLASAYLDFYKDILNSLPSRAVVHAIHCDCDPTGQVYSQFDISVGLLNFPLSFFVWFLDDNEIATNLRAAAVIKEKYISKDYINYSSPGSYDFAITSILTEDEPDFEFTLSGKSISAAGPNDFKLQFGKDPSNFDQTIRYLPKVLKELSNGLKKYSDTQDPIIKKFSEWYVDLSSEYGDVKLEKIDVQTAPKVHTWIPSISSFSSDPESGKITIGKIHENQ